MLGKQVLLLQFMRLMACDYDWRFVLANAFGVSFDELVASLSLSRFASLLSWFFADEDGVSSPRIALRSPIVEKLSFLVLLNRIELSIVDIESPLAQDVSLLHVDS